ncbi:MAG TPA: BON domain-containing protein [Edaphocola sp.]|nr:BON domain-containing protein [Edaphocola sp.]
MNTKKILPALMIAAIVAFTIPACKSKVSDTDVKAKVEAAMTVPGVSIDVKDGVVTLSGSVATDAEKTAAETAVSTLDAKSGVKSVQNNITVAAAPAPAPVINAVDSELTTKITDLLKDFPGVNATVKDGIITVTGALEKAKVTKLKQLLDALNPKKTDMSQLTVK